MAEKQHDRVQRCRIGLGEKMLIPIIFFARAIIQYTARVTRITDFSYTNNLSSPICIWYIS